MNTNNSENANIKTALQFTCNISLSSLFPFFLLTCYFRTAFKKTREVYSKLGQHTYSHQLDSKRPLQINRGALTGGHKYIYFGQLGEGTNNKDGVGIRVDSDGAIIEGCWKNGNANGKFFFTFLILFY